MNIYQKLLKIQQKINGLGKDKAGNNFRYVTGDKLLSEVKPMMNDLGLILKQEIISIDNERMDYRTGIGTQHEKPKSEILSKVMMKFTWIDCESMEKDENLFGANGQNDWDKGVGSAMTYGERYFLLKYFHIATDEDDIDNPELKKEDVNTVKETPKDDTAEISKRLESSKTLEELQSNYKSLSEPNQKKFATLTTEIKAKLSKPIK
jgi:hypothetical protein